MPIFSAGSASVNVVPNFSDAQKKITEFFAAQKDISVTVKPNLSDTDVAKTEAELNAMHGTAKVEIDKNALSSSITSAIQTALATSGLDKLGAVLSAAIGPTVMTAIGGAFVELAAVASQAVGAIALVPAAMFAIAAPAAVAMIGVSGMGAAFKALDTGNAQQIAKTMAALAPAAQSVVTQVFALKPAFDTLRLDVQQALFAGVGTAVTNLANVALPILHGGLTQIAGAMNTGLLATMTALQGQGASFTTLFGNIAGAIKVASGAAAPLIQAFMTLAGVGSQFLPVLAAGFVDVSHKFNDWVQNMAASGQLVSIIQKAIDTIKELGKIAGNVASVVVGVFTAALPGGALLLEALGKVTGGLATFVHSTDGQTALKSFFDQISSAVSLVLPAFSNLVQAIVTDVLPQIGALARILAPIAATLLNQIADGFRSIGGILPPVASVVGALAAALAPLIPVITQIVQALLPPLVKFLGDLAPILGQVSQILGQALLQAVKLIAPVLPVIADAVIAIVKAIVPLIEPLTKMALELLPPLLNVVKALVPIIQSAAGVFADIAGVFLKIVQATVLPLLVGLINGLADGLKVLSPFLGPLAGIILAIWAAMKLWAAIQVVLNLLLDANPIGLFVLAIGLLITALGLIVTHWQAIVDFLQGVWNGVVDFVTQHWKLLVAAIPLLGPVILAVIAIIQNFGGIWQAVITGLKTAWDATSGALSTAWSAFWGALQAAAQAVWGAITGAWSAFAGALSATWSAVSGAITGAWTAFWNGLQTAAQAIWTAIQAAWTGFIVAIQVAWAAFVATLSAAWSAFWAALQAAAQAVWTAIQAGWTGFIVAIQVAWAAFVAALSAAWSAFWAALQAAAQAIWTAIQAGWTAFIVAIQVAWAAFVAALSAAWSAFWAALQAAAQAIWTAIQAAWTGFIVAIQVAWAAFVATLSAAWSAFWGGLQTVAQAIWSALQSAWSTAVNAVRSAFDAFASGLSTAWGALWDGLKAAASAAWDALKAAVETPVKFVVNTVINGLINGIDDVMKFLGLSFHISPIVLGFAEGGYTGDGIFGTGGKYDPAGIVHAGEFVINQQQTAKYMPLLSAINSGTDGYAAGGLVGALPGYATGGLVAEIAGLVTDPVGTIVSFVSGLIGSTLGNAPLEQMVKAVPTQVAPLIGNWIIGEIKGALTSLLSTAGSVANSVLSALGSAASGVLSALGISTGTSGSTAGNVTVAGFTGPAAVAQWGPDVLQVLTMLGRGAGEEGAVLRRIQFESGGNPNAINLTDSNALAGDPSRGLMQVIQTTFDAYRSAALANNIYDPMANIYAGSNYAVHRYGSLAAIDPLVKPTGYDTGGWLPPGYSSVYNGTGGFEAVLNQAQQAAVTHAVGGSSGPSQFTGDLYLDSGEFLGKVRGVAMDIVNGQNDRDGRLLRSHR